MTDTIVNVNIKIVKNLGNFESLHLEAGCTAPLRSGETFDEGFKRVYGAVERNLEDKIAETVAELKKIGK